MSDFAKNLKKIRKQKGYTQQKLAQKLNYGSTAIANYEGGRNEPSLDDLISLCELLEVTPNELLGVPVKEEQPFIDSYRNLQPKQQKIILDMIDALKS